MNSTRPHTEQLCHFCAHTEGTTDQIPLGVPTPGWRATLLYLICSLELLACHLKQGEQSSSWRGLSWQTQRDASCLSPALVLWSFFPHSTNKARPVNPHLGRTAIIAQIRSLRVWQGNGETLGLSYHSVSLHLPLHASPVPAPCIVTTGSAPTLQGL